MLKTHIKELKDKGSRSLAAAQALFERGDFDFAISRAYYAMFYYAEAILLTKGLEFSKHSGVIRAFSQEFIKTGILPKELGKNLAKAFEARSIGDYDLAFPDQQESEIIINDALNFINELNKIFSEKNNV